MANKLNFTKRALDALPIPAKGKRTYYNDTQIKGLQCAVTDSGNKSFVVYKRINGKPTRIKLGNYPALTVEQGRNEAYKVLGDISKGEDPASNKRRARAQSVTLGQTFEDYVAMKRHNLKPKTLYDYEKVLALAFTDWRNKRLVDITKPMVQKKNQHLGEKHGGAYANLAMRILSSLFNFAILQYEDAQGNSLILGNPVTILKKTGARHRVKRRDSYIRADDLPDWYEAVLTLKQEPVTSTAHTVGEYLLLLLLTGLRRQEAARLTWDNVDLKNKTLTVTDTKNHEDHTLPLSDYLYRLLSDRRKHIDSEYVFPSATGKGHLVEPRTYIAQVIKASSVNFRIHDLRRTFATVAERADIPAYALKRLLNHKNSGDVTAGYLIIGFERLREPMQLITDVILTTASHTNARQPDTIY